MVTKLDEIDGKLMSIEERMCKLEERLLPKKKPNVQRIG